MQLSVRNNILSNNTTYGLKFAAGAVNATVLNARGWAYYNNCFYNNTSGATLPASIGTGNNTTNPTFTNSGSNDYSIGTNLKAQGWPLGGTNYIGTYSATYSYVDPGAAQRQEAPNPSSLILQPTGTY